MAHLAIHQSSSKQIFARSEKTPLYAGILTYEYQQSVGKIPRGEPICGCDVDGYRPDTLGGGIESETYWYVIAQVEGPENVAHKQEAYGNDFEG